jgi:hypothetical protein
VTFRELTELNTQVRILSVISQLLRILAKESLPEEIIKFRLIRWSAAQETSDTGYGLRTGKLTNKGKATSAFPRYLSFAKALGLIESIGQTHRRSRLGTPLSALIGDTDPKTTELSDEEKIFYLLILLWKDADPLLCILDRMATESDRGVRQLDLQREFGYLYQNRLQAKIDHSPDENFRQIVFKRLTTIASEWKNPARYAEHIVPPRLEWLRDLGVLKIASGKIKTFCFSDSIFASYQSWPKIAVQTSDLSDHWIWTSFMSYLGCNLIGRPYRSWDVVELSDRTRYLAPLLKTAFSVLTSRGVPRVPLNTTMIYAMIRLAVDHGVVVNFEQLQNFLAGKHKIGNRKYQVRLSPRENESYILAMTI